jgi:RND family efflux transporter MFP subunit
MTQTRRQWLIFSAALFVLVAVALYSLYGMRQQAARTMPEVHRQMPRPDVSVVTVNTARHPATMVAYGAAETHYQLTLTAEVSGRVENLAEGFEVGARLAIGTELARIEASNYRAALAVAESERQQARVTLLEEERQALQAEAEWRASGLEGEPDSPLVLRQPQLAAARAALNNAQAAVESARYDLAQTRITLPFDALVISRDIAPGSYLQAGAQVATVYSSDRVEITLSLPARDWQNLPDGAQLLSGNWPVFLTGVESGQQWQGRVLRTEQHLDGETRQRSLVVAVDQPLALEKPLLPGTFLKARLAGDQVDGLWQLPSSARSQRGEIWFVNPGGQLDHFATDPLFNDGEHIYVRAPKTLSGTPVQVLSHPLNSYLKGMLVNPVEAAEND